MLFQCWASVEDGRPTFKQHWVNVPCLPGRCFLQNKFNVFYNFLQVAKSGSRESE